MRGRPVPLEITETELATAVSEAAPARQTAWAGLSPERRAAYLEETRRFGGEPPELTALLREGSMRETWNAAPLLVRLEWSRWINHGRTGLQRRRRAQRAVVEAPHDVQR